VLKLFIQRGSTLSDNKGVAAVEFALILPLLLLLILSLVDFGRLFFVQVSVTSASREGARYSSLYSNGAPTPQNITDLVNASAPGAATLAQLSSNATLNVTQSPCSTATLNENTTIEVSTNYKWLLPVGVIRLISPNSSLVSDFTISSKGVMRCVG
jgi:Flp pilus assembly protein TadG